MKITMTFDTENPTVVHSVDEHGQPVRLTRVHFATDPHIREVEFLDPEHAPVVEFNCSDVERSPVVMKAITPKRLGELAEILRETLKERQSP